MSILDPALNRGTRANIDVQTLVQTSTIGSAGIRVSRIGLGCVTFGREIDEAQSFRLLDHAFEKGINLLDTSEAYGGGQAEAYRRAHGLPGNLAVSDEMHSSEKIIGRWLRSTGVRERIVIQTKVTREYTRAHLREALNASLDRLGTDRVDLYLFHSFDPGTPLEEAMTAMAEVIGSGAVRVGGCSNFSTDQLRFANEIAANAGLPRLETIQPVYNLVRRGIERDLLPLCNSTGVAAVIYSPLGAGFLAGKYTADGAFPRRTRFDLIPDHANQYFSEENFRTVDRLRVLSERLGVSMVQLAMNWVVHKPSIAGVLIGARSVAHIDNAINALSVPPIEQIEREVFP